MEREHAQMPPARRRARNIRPWACELRRCDVSGSNGPILFRDDHPSSGIGNPLFRASPDGTHVTVLSSDRGCSRTGARMVAASRSTSSSEQIATMPRYGSDLKVITHGKGIHEAPSYSPSGRRLSSSPPTRTRARRASGRTCGSCALTGPVRTGWPWRAAASTSSRGTPRRICRQVDVESRSARTGGRATRVRAAYSRESVADSATGLSRVGMLRRSKQTLRGFRPRADGQRLRVSRVARLGCHLRPPGTQGGRG
jgi:hypothetical protein